MLDFAIICRLKLLKFLAGKNLMVHNSMHISDTIIKEKKREEIKRHACYFLSADLQNEFIKKVSKQLSLFV